MSEALDLSSESKRVLIVAGEASGDRYGGALMRELRSLVPGIVFTGIGGRHMREAGLSPVMDAEQVAVLGFFEVLTSLPVIRRAFNRCIEQLASRPDLVILIDYPGFNLRLARKAREAGIQVAYFVSPQVWAWKPGRVKTIAETVTRMLVIFPFEEAFYRERGVEAIFVGHPLVEILRTSGPRMERAEAASLFGLDPSRRIVGLLPGSRLKEVRRNLPPILGAARLLSERFEGVQFLLPVASTLRVDALRRMLGRNEVTLTDSDFYEALNLCETAIVSSGTATMEVGLLGLPMVVVYRLHPLTYGLARAMTGLEMVAMVNLVAGRRIVPELIQSDCTAEKIAREIEMLLSDRVRYERTRRELREMRGKLGGGGAFKRAAEEIAVLLR